ncbi:MAG: endonuclease/exonuclease/phosphatase family protein [Ectothiorhodospiraceae bacterium]|jgi:endonuclease/exonuclease/phosphatase family metal-dependent hydrolase|nr:endonuclease/exonuclease/phosphatase family protein [Ectothiorhodospiraceae bacterium]
MTAAAATRIPRTLRIISFNVACGHLFTTHRDQRMDAIGRRLKELDPDLVAIQEAFTHDGRARLFAALEGSRLVYRADFPAGVVGNGMLTLSAWPIVERTFHRYRHGSPWYKIHQGDWWAGKGVGLTRIALPELDLDFYNTHTQPDRGDPANAVARRGQMTEMADFIGCTRRPDVPLIAAGDFNTGVGAADLGSLLAATGLRTVAAPADAIDFVLTADATSWHFEPAAARAIHGSIAGSHAAIFLDRAPTPAELWRMHFGHPEMTPLSDHPGYVVDLHLTPQANDGEDVA